MNHGGRCEQACLNGLLGSRPSSCMANRMRLCTGFRPSRTSGSARPTITDIAYCKPNSGFCECKRHVQSAEGSANLTTP